MGFTHVASITSIARKKKKKEEEAKNTYFFNPRTENYLITHNKSDHKCY